MVTEKVEPISVLLVVVKVSPCLFLTRLLMKSQEMESPTIVIITDRTDLDDQLVRSIHQRQRLYWRQCGANRYEQNRLTRETKRQKQWWCILNHHS